jgi:hypothetical protein
MTVMMPIAAVALFAGSGLASELFFGLRVDRMIDPFGYRPLASLAGMAIVAAAGLALLLTWTWLWKRGAARVPATQGARR